MVINTPTNEHTETCLRECLKKEGYTVSRRRGMGETGVDILAKKDGEEYHIEVIGFKKSPPQRTKDFCVVFFGAISRLKDGAKKIVIAVPERFGNGLNQRASHYGEGWGRIGNTFPELEIWLVNCEKPYSYKKSKWKHYSK